MKALDVTLPDYTDEQLQRDTIRGFNGWAGGVHQYRVKLDAKGMLDVLEDPGTDLGRRFPDVPVLRPVVQEFPQPAVFFFDR